MLVDVVCLRCNGAKLPSDEVLAAKPVRRLLTIDTVAVGPPGADSPHPPLEIARLWQCEQAAGPVPVDGLECARVSRVGGDCLLVVGVERQIDSAGHPQAWWCRVVLDANAGNPARDRSA